MPTFGSRSTRNQQSEIRNSKGPALLTTRGLSSNLCKAAVERLAELFSGLFYVAASRLNSPRFVVAIETLMVVSVKDGPVLPLSVNMM